MTIASEIQRIKTNIANAYTSCNSKGATMPVAQNSANLATTINSISGGSATLITKNITQNGTYNASSDNANGYSSVTVNVSGGGGGSSDWQPDPDWWDIKSILEADTRSYAGKAIILYSNSDNFTQFTISSPLVAVATSDGAFYTATATHTWDRSKDKIVSSDSSDITPKYGTRYLILYFNTADVDYTALTNFINGDIYAVFGCNLTKNSSSTVTSNTFFYGNRSLQSFDFLTGYNLNFGTSFDYFCYNCYSLAKLPDNLNTSSGTSFSGFCYDCYSLAKLPDNLNTSSGTSFNNFCRNCYSLAKLPDNLNTSGTSFSGFCSNCYSLVKANIKLASVSVTTLSQSTLIDIQSLEYIANNAPTVTGTVKLTIGSTNITRAGGANGTIIQTLVNKGWTVN